ncbi:hypothetical protein [Clostridium tagluense]|uniref:Uncharacterized protein n=1 Tax=Clostridium tagluense TaxID=360422 RepID=A0A401UQA5_9CLOT|nr:hypothetical protein [Clostridium tagluense]GCD11707.1 hypothetical protein Ctaglu_33300 [Clostridium tagluense]
MAEKLFKNGRFDFIGELTQGKEILSVKKLSDASKWSRTKLNIGVKDDSNAQFVTMEYIHTDTVKTCKLLGKDGEMFDINLADTNLPSTFEKTSDFVKIIIDLETDFDKKKEYTKLIYKKHAHEFKKAEDKTPEDEVAIKDYDEQIRAVATNRVEFCHIKDAITFLNQALPLFKGYKIRATGNIKSNYYDGKNNLQYVPNYIEIVPVSYENQLKAYLDIFYEKDSIDDDKKMKKFIVNGYVGDRVKRADKLYPLTVVIDYTNVDEEIPEHVMLLDFMKDTFKITDKKQMHKMGVEINIINGSEKLEFDESKLTDQQKLAITFGKNKLSDFAPKGNIYGDRITELRVSNGDLKNYPNGSVEVFKAIDITDYLVADDSDKKADTTKKADAVKDDDTEKPVELTEQEILMKKLFNSK